MEILSVKEFVKPGNTAAAKMSPFGVMYLDAPQFDMPCSEMPPANIKVIGTGGGGSNAVNRMIEGGLSGVQFIAVNTDIQDLKDKSKAHIKLQIGKNTTGGRGAGGKPECGEAAAKEDYELLSETIRGADMVFVTAGMGGGTGTGSAPVIARIARDLGALTVGVVTKPFENEGSAKMKLAEAGIKKLREAVDTLIIIPNENLFKIIDRKTSIMMSLRIADDVLRQGVQGISDLITKTGIINVDFADVQSTMKGQGDALMGIGVGDGDNRAIDAAGRAIDNPLLEDTNIEGATRLLVNISGPEDIALVEVDEIMKTIKAKADPEVEIIKGINVDPELGEKIKVTVIATGFRNRDAAEQHKNTMNINKEIETDNFIHFERFKQMTGQGSRNSNDGYNGMYKPDLQVPTAIRWNFEAEERGKAAVGGVAVGGRET